MSRVPWQIKILAKILLRRLPVGYSFWKKIGIFRHGYMESVEYSYSIFKTHFENVKPPKNFVSLELGPGDSVLSAIMNKAFGGSRCYLVDSGYFANFQLSVYQKAETFLQASDLKFQSDRLTKLKDSASSPEQILELYDCQYLTDGLDSLHSIPDKSVDLVWSQAVLEHVRQRDFVATMKELRRIIRENGKCSHTIDLKDHLGGSLNNLRFSGRVWESEFMASSGFYTNRIRYSEMIRLFEATGFAVEVTDIQRWDSLPIPRAKLAQEFQHLSDDELCVQEFTVILTPQAQRTFPISV
ncbi:class I SAM-dependent methyltransferase [Halomicronema sp. CCY15110]|uniref:methyltransferase domain-containing protein n=1 Tax=Halomicronema sp. CCY15110 TaxID=2767773 RepID=UPI001951E178|nr:class I SAM-dependent methyltransferase [Halomicronema sp. CCY15110]